MLNKWMDCFKNRNFLMQWIITIITAVPILISLVFVLRYIEGRTSTVLLPDPILKAIIPMDLSVFIFILLYSLSVLGIFYLLQFPHLALIAAQSYLLILVFRMLCMFIAPLEPPAGIIPLHDFILENTFYSGNVNVKDLFFSGHTSVIFLFFLVIDNRKLRKVFFAGTLAIGGALIIQHAHYTIDILGAIGASYTAVTIIKKTCGKIHQTC